jgi:cytochrome b6-f complex iron-sulfur subunit
MRTTDIGDVQPLHDSLVQIDGVNPKRRRVLKGILGAGIVASLGSFLYPVLRYLVPPPVADLGGDTVVAGRVGELQPNSSKIFRFGSRPGLLIRTANDEYRALSATCTHLGCTVQYKPDQHRIWCACHNGMFDLAGRNISGPPPRPLEVFDVHVQGDELVVSRKREA